MARATTTVYTGVNRRPLADERVHVGDGDLDPRRAVGQAFRDLELIEVARRLVVDGRPGQLAQVADALAGADGRRVRLQRGDLAQDLLREFGLEAMRAHGVGGGSLKVDVSGGVLHISHDST